MAEYGGNTGMGLTSFNVINLEVQDMGGVPINVVAPNTSFNIVATVEGSGPLWSVLPGIPSWKATFYADAIGIDVTGELRYPTPNAALVAIGGGKYSVSVNVPAGINVEGLFEIGVIVHLPASGVNGYGRGVSLEVIVSP